MDELRQLQEACTSILFNFNEVCKQNNLTYYLAYGTLLGAIRHEGFIPWDDDIDLFMPREDMQKLIDNFKDWFPDDFYINHYTAPNFTSNSYVLRICNPRIKFLRSIGGKGKEFDSFVSIFPICGMPRNVFMRAIFKKRIELAYMRLRFVRSANCGYGDVKRSFKENIGVFINKMLNLGKGKNVAKYVESIDKLFFKYPLDNSKKVGVYSYGLYPMIFDRKWFGNPSMKKFESVEMPVPRNYGAILYLCYKNFMTLPPEESRKPKHSYKIITSI